MDKQLLDLLEAMVIGAGIEANRRADMRVDFFYGLCCALDLAFTVVEDHDSKSAGETFEWVHRHMVAKNAITPTRRTGMAVVMAEYLVHSNYAGHASSN